MQLYQRGIRRRTAPMLGNHRARLELSHSRVLTLPETPVVRNGDEIGMGENLESPERDAIRTPMQWANAKNGGFSLAQPDRLVLPVVSGGEFGYEKVNVAAEQRDLNSFLNWMERMTRLRMRTPEFGNGACEFLEASDPAVLAHCCSGERSSVYAIHNFSGRELEVTVEFGRKVKGLFDLLRNTECPLGEDGGRGRFRLEAYGYKWLREGRGLESLARVID
jgi:maltose alpha-D-glucosyltransferase / alpha-amylase